MFRKKDKLTVFIEEVIEALYSENSITQSATEFTYKIIFFDCWNAGTSRYPTYVLRMDNVKMTNVSQKLLRKLSIAIRKNWKNSPENPQNKVLELI